MVLVDEIGEFCSFRNDEAKQFPHLSIVDEGVEQEFKKHPKLLDGIIRRACISLECLLKRCRGMPDHRLEKSLLGFEIDVDRAFRHSHPLGNVLHPRGRKSSLGEFLECGVENFQRTLYLLFCACQFCFCHNPGSLRILSALAFLPVAIGGNDRWFAYSTGVKTGIDFYKTWCVVQYVSTSPDASARTRRAIRNDHSGSQV
ncbi:hypothetical protein AGR1A_Lc80122 [Agrobacterium fabacearum CFBP 5771]|nr:hypothetical protein AGR1A_Lc80122 [Agrobacterium fabacearum CFBP 5771]